MENTNATEEMETKATPEEIPAIEVRENGKVISSNSYSTVYEYKDRYFRETGEGWCEVLKCRSRFFFLKAMTPLQETSTKSFLDQALEFVPMLHGGEILERFKSSGGIIKTLESKFFRVTYLHGMQEVREGFERWKTVSDVYTANELKKLIKANREQKGEKHV